MIWPSTRLVTVTVYTGVTVPSALMYTPIGPLFAVAVVIGTENVRAFAFAFAAACAASCCRYTYQIPPSSSTAMISQIHAWPELCSFLRGCCVVRSEALLGVRFVSGRGSATEIPFI